MGFFSKRGPDEIEADIRAVGNLIIHTQKFTSSIVDKRINQLKKLSRELKTLHM